MLNRRMAELKSYGSRTPLLDLSHETGIGIRALSRIITGQEFISFDHADRITCRLEGPLAWHDRSRLRQIYRSANLRMLDWASPVSEKVAQELHEIAVGTIAQKGSIAAAAKALKVSKHSFSMRLAA